MARRRLPVGIQTFLDNLDQPLPLGYCNVSVVVGAGNR
jgi:hypothetical protein